MCFALTVYPRFCRPGLECVSDLPQTPSRLFWLSLTIYVPTLFFQSIGWMFCPTQAAISNMQAPSFIQMTAMKLLDAQSFQGPHRNCRWVLLREARCLRVCYAHPFKRPCRATPEAGMFLWCVSARAKP